ATDSSTWTKNAYGGTDVQGGEGGAGTIYMKPSSGAGSLILDGNNIGTQANTALFASGSATQYSFQDLTVINGATLVVASPGACSPNALTVRGTITTTGGTITDSLLDSLGIRCFDRPHQYLNYPGTLTFTQPDIDAYDFYKRFSDTGVLQFALHSNLLYTADDIDLTALTYEKDGTSIAVNIPADPNLSTRHTMYIPNTNAGNGVYLCPNATTLAGVVYACSGMVVFGENEVEGLTPKTVGSATGVTVTLVNATDTGVGSVGDTSHLYKVIGLAGTGGGPYLNVEFDLNNGDTTAEVYDAVQITNIENNSNPGFPNNTFGAYRWTLNGANLMALNIPFNSGSTQFDFSTTVSPHNGTPQNGPVYTTSGKVGGAMVFDGTNDYITLGNNFGINWQSDNFTISVWAQSTAVTQNWRGIIGNRFGTGSGNWWTLGLADSLYGTCSANSISFEMGGANTCLGTSFFPNGQGWHHYAVRKTGTTIEIFIDGSLVSTGSVGGSHLGSTTNDVYLGQWLSPG